MSKPRVIRGSLALSMLVRIPVGIHAFQTSSQPAPVQLTAQEDLERMMDLLHIDTLRRGADGRNKDAPNAAGVTITGPNSAPVAT